MRAEIRISAWLDRIAKLKSYTEMRKAIIDMSEVLKKTSSNIPKEEKKE